MDEEDPYARNLFTISQVKARHWIGNSRLNFMKGDFKKYSHIFHAVHAGEDGAEEALVFLIKEHGDVLAKVLAGLPNELGLNLKAVYSSNVDSLAGSAIGQTKRNHRIQKVGRLMIYAGAIEYGSAEAAANAVEKVLPRGRSWILERWKEFRDFWDEVVTERKEKMLDERDISMQSGKKPLYTRDEIDLISKTRLDPRYDWNQEFITGRVTIESIKENPGDWFKL